MRVSQLPLQSSGSIIRIVHINHIIHKFICLGVDISMMVTGDASDVIGCDRKAPELPV